MAKVNLAEVKGCAAYERLDLLTGGVIKGPSSLSLFLISCLCACVLSYVSAAWEIERDEGKQGHQPPAAPLIPRHQVNYNYCARCLQQHQNFVPRAQDTSDLQTSPAEHPTHSVHFDPIRVLRRVQDTELQSTVIRSRLNVKVA